MKLSRFIDKISGRLSTAKRFRMRAAYQSTLHSILRFRQGSSPEIKTVFTKSFLRRYQKHLLEKGLKSNTISFYMTVLRIIHNTAVEMGLLPASPGLFDHVIIGFFPATYDPIPPKVIERIYKADLSEVPRLKRCRDYFIFSFFSRGMTFMDMAFLQKDNIHNDCIIYRNIKTRKSVVVPMSAPMKEILSRHIDSGGRPYAFPVVSPNGADEYRQYISALRQYNRHLKKLGQYLGIDENLSSSSMRRSWNPKAQQQILEELEVAV